ncbi:hypothetical protein BD410DRAFT_286153 [Rickenella mellea]|uniref:Uncharacterized protein n=1 Tax=Rickenella mellea TaxID=50990 RepID=A0A4Y7Q1W0_9AGAM|nr:hypothetical protein BD410DRAFT_286153 [Rickenella mellea]
MKSRTILAFCDLPLGGLHAQYSRGPGALYTQTVMKPCGLASLAALPARTRYHFDACSHDRSALRFLSASSLSGPFTGSRPAANSTLREITMRRKTSPGSTCLGWSLRRQFVTLPFRCFQWCPVVSDTLLESMARCRHSIENDLLKCKTRRNLNSGSQAFEVDSANGTPA